MRPPFIRRPSPYELPRVAKDELFDVPPAPSLAYGAEAAAIARIRTARPGARWAVGVDHKGAWAVVDGHEARARRASYAELLDKALEKALAHG